MLVPSPKVAPTICNREMSAAEVTDRLIGRARTPDFDVIVCNFANGDMVGHTGDFERGGEGRGSAG